MNFLPWLAVGSFGLLVSVGELVSRYRDSPGRLLRSPLAMLYCVGNVTAAALTFGMLRGFGWTAGLGADEAEKIVWIQTISAGF